MLLPGPSGVEWGLSLLGFGLLTGVIGESIRIVFERRVSLFRPPDWLERTVLDIFLGVGALYLVAALPLGLYYPATPLVLAAVLGSVAMVAHFRRRRRGVGAAVRMVPWRWPHVVAIAAALALFAIELVATDGAGAANTYDGSLYALYTGLLSTSHSLPWTLSPIVDASNPFPQGATAFFGGGEMLLGVPPPRVSLLLTPLFFALVPIAGFVWGRRWMGSEGAGAAFALVLALLGTWTRTLVYGSNDFVLAFPLTLLLLAWATQWWGGPVIDLRNTVAYGGLTAIAAVLNPVGPEWLLLVIVLGGALARPRFAGQPAVWLSRWLVALGTSLVLILPSVVALLVGPSAASQGYAPAGQTGMGATFATFVGSVNPFLFGPNDDLLSPFPILRIELALLIVAGVLLLLFARRLGLPEGASSRFGRGVLAAVLVAVLLLALQTLAAGSGASVVRGLTNPAELSILLFTVYTAIAAFPLALLFLSPPQSRAVASPRRLRRAARAALGERPRVPAMWIALLLSVAILAPGVAVTSSSLPDYLADTYTTFGNVTVADYDMLSWSAAHLPDGSRVLMAPGSAAQFLPGYDPSLVPVFPVLVVGESTNASYRLIVGELNNGTLDPAGIRAIAELRVQFIAVTQVNTALWPAFSPTPLLRSPDATSVFHEGDAWVFAWSPA